MNHSELSKEQILGILSSGNKNLLALGASGVGMSGLCALLCRDGHSITGYDRDPTPIAQMLGDRVTMLTDPCQVKPQEYDMAYYSLAMDESWSRVLSGVPTASRAQVLGALMTQYSRSVAVSGSHGKSTVTALIDHLFCRDGRSPTTLLGAHLSNGSTCREGSRSLLLCEACEYRNAFLHLFPSVFLFLNLELDHTDCFDSIENLVDSFAKAGKQADRVILNLDDKNLEKVNKRLQNKAISFGFEGEYDYRAEWICEKNGIYPFRLFHRGTLLGEVHPRLVGRHGARNTLAAVALCLEEGMRFDSILSYLSSFEGIARRLEHVCALGEHPIYYDYAHHPTEIAASIRAIAEKHREVPTVLFCPHTYTRTRDLWDGFVMALGEARRALIAPIFAAREAPLPGISAEHLAHAIGHGAEAIFTPDQLFLALGEREPLILMGAGDLGEFLNAVREHAQT